MARSEFPAKVKLARWEHCGGFCEGCGVKIRPGNGPEYDHATMAAVGGPATLENCRCLCTNCHGIKTHTIDVPAIAKTKRIRAKHANAETKPRRGFTAWRRFDGTIVRR